MAASCFAAAARRRERTRSRSRSVSFDLCRHKTLQPGRDFAFVSDHLRQVNLDAMGAGVSRKQICLELDQRWDPHCEQNRGRDLVGLACDDLLRLELELAHQ